jgi:acetyl esterase/lipase
MRTESNIGRVAVIVAVMAAALIIARPSSADDDSTVPAEPTIANFSYGDESERQQLDFWQAPSDRPTPVVVLIHGGGWIAGDKSGYKTDSFEEFLKRGVSVARINYRFIPQAMEQKVEPPVKACLLDAARALQTIRSKAGEWNVDSKRIGATGGSAGACTSLWLALHDDLANPDSDDPVARQSTRLSCAAVTGAQTAFDPEELRKWIPNAVYGGHAFGFYDPNHNRQKEFDQLMAHREEVLPWIKEYSPIEHVSKDDPPIYLDFPNQKSPPVEGQTEADPTHSAMYGVKLAEKLDAAGVEAIVAYPGHKDAKYETPGQFLLAKLQGGDY